MDGQLLVGLPYLRTLVAMANEKFRANSARIQRFYDLFALRFPPELATGTAGDGGRAPDGDGGFDPTDDAAELDRVRGSRLVHLSDVRQLARADRRAEGRREISHLPSPRGGARLTSGAGAPCLVGSFRFAIGM